MLSRMKRLLFRLVVISSLLLCTATMTIWAGSQWHILDDFSIGPWFLVDCDQSDLRLQHNILSNVPELASRINKEGICDSYGREDRYLAGTMCRYWLCQQRGSYPPGTLVTCEIQVHCWFLCLLFAILPGS